MTTQEKTQAVKAKIVELIPEIRVGLSQWPSGERPIRLSDVLRAIGETCEIIAVDINGTFWNLLTNKCYRDDTGASIYWNLAKDSLEDQDEACISFLHSLLCPGEVE